MNLASTLRSEAHELSPPAPAPAEALSFKEEKAGDFVLWWTHALPAGTHGPALPAMDWTRRYARLCSHTRLAAWVDEIGTPENGGPRVRFTTFREGDALPAALPAALVREELERAAEAMTSSANGNGKDARPAQAIPCRPGAVTSAAAMKQAFEEDGGFTSVELDGAARLLVDLGPHRLIVEPAENGFVRLSGDLPVVVSLQTEEQAFAVRLAVTTMNRALLAGRLALAIVPGDPMCGTLVLEHHDLPGKPGAGRAEARLAARALFAGLVYAGRLGLHRWWLEEGLLRTVHGLHARTARDRGGENKTA